MSYDTIGRPFSPFDFFQKKSRLILSRLFDVDLGNLKQYIVWQGRDSRLDWIRTTLPALEMEPAFQFCNLLSALWARSKKEVVQAFPWKTGQPRCLSKDSQWGIWNTATTYDLAAKLPFLEKTSTNF